MKRTKLSAVFMILLACIMVFGTTVTAKAALSFTDVKAGEFYYEPIQWAVEKGITTGYSSVKFGPNDTCTRGQIVTLLWRAAGSSETENENCSFKDVNNAQYYYDAVLWAVAEGITSGYNADKFGPEDTCTRGQIVTFLWRYMGNIKPASNSHAFTDIAYGQYYYEPVLWAVENGITKGLNEDLFGSNEWCTRGQAVTFLYRALGDNLLKDDPLLKKLMEKGLLPLNADSDDLITNEQFIALLIEEFGYELSDHDLGNPYDISSKFYPYYVTAVENGILGDDDLAAHGEDAVGTDVVIWTGNAIGIQNGLDELYKDVPEGNLSITQAVELVKAAASWKQENMTVRSDAKNELQLQENVRYTQADESTNVPINIDTINKKVTLQNPDAVVQGLKVGEVLYISPGEGFPEGFLAKITKIEKKSGAVVLTCEEPELFEIIKEADISTVITLGPKSQARTLSDGPSIEFDDGEGYYDSDSAKSEDGLFWYVYGGAEKGATVHFETENFASKKGVYAALDMGIKVFVDIGIRATDMDVESFHVSAVATSTITGEAGYGTGGESDIVLELPDCTVPIAGPVSMNIKPYLHMSASGEITVNVMPTLTTSASFLYSQRGVSYGIMPTATADFTAQAEGKLETGLGTEVGLQLCGTPFFDGVNLLAADVEAGVGVQGKTNVKQDISTDGSDLSYEGNQNTPDENGVVHTCYVCIGGPIYAYADMEIGLGDEIRGILKKYLELDPVYSEKIEETLWNWYYCTGKDYGPEFHFGICPHKKYEVEILVKDKNTSQMISGVNIQIGNENGVTDADGKVVVYLEKGFYNIKASSDSCEPKSVTKLLEVKDKRIKIEIKVDKLLDIIKSSPIQEYRGQVYTTLDVDSSSGMKKIPNLGIALDMIIYNDYVYYANVTGTDYGPTTLYRMRLDGTEKTVVAEHFLFEYEYCIYGNELFGTVAVLENDSDWFETWYDAELKLVKINLDTFATEDVGEDFVSGDAIGTVYFEGISEEVWVYSALFGEAVCSKPGFQGEKKVIPYSIAMAYDIIGCYGEYIYFWDTDISVARISYNNLEEVEAFMSGIHTGYGLVFLENSIYKYAEEGDGKVYIYRYDLDNGTMKKVDFTIDGEYQTVESSNFIGEIGNDLYFKIPNKSSSVDENMIGYKLNLETGEKTYLGSWFEV